MQQRRAKRTKRSPFEALRTLLNSEEPLTWLFTGGAPATADDVRRHHTYMEHVAAHLRRDRLRKCDIVVNTWGVGQTLGQVVNDLEGRILRFHPSLVVLTVGFDDSVHGRGGRDAFADALDKLI